jgi:membrane-bound metal-dependent hydrolase YbcI (DUF457 family)
LGNYRQHITFASVLGIVYAWGAFALAGVHWVYGSVAALLSTLSGLLPDLDSASGVELKGFTGILGVLVALAVWAKLADVRPQPAFEFQLWAVVSAFVLVRHGIRRVLSRMSIHRGISHSLPTCAVWGALAYLHYPASDQSLRIVMGIAVVIGFLSHLLLDEICSVDLRGVRVNKAFGTAIKLWAPSPWSTLAMYTILSYLAWRIIETWPDGPFQFDPPAPPSFPIEIELPKQLDSYPISPARWR